MQLSKNQFPPWGWKFYQPQTNWNAPPNSSFSIVSAAIKKMRLNNPGKGLATNLDAIEEELLDYTRARVNALLPGHYDDVPVQAKKKLTGWPGVVNRARDRAARLAGGVETLLEWIGSGEPVASGVAAMRAVTCSKCPMNQDGGALEVVTGPIAAAIQSQMAIKHDLNLTTDSDSKLHTCTACDCQLKLKVWVPIGTILERTSDDTLTRFHQDCWIPAEKKKTRLLIVIPFCLKDAGLAKTLLQWVNELGPCDSDCLLVADCKVQKPTCSEIVALATSAFRKVTLIFTPYSLPNEQWPYGPNWMFKTALKYIGDHLRSAFLWLEPDCTPLKSGWSAQLQSGYQASGKPFMGAVVHSSGQPDRPGDHLTGCAIYPANAYELLWDRLNERPEAFDMSTATISVPLAHHSNLFFHSWGPRAKNDPGKIPKEAVLHHQCKDGSLITRLRKQ